MASTKRPSDGTKQPEPIFIKYADRTLGSGNLRLAVTLPEGEELNEWLAVNTVDFYNQINMLYATLTEFCTEAQCPIMNASSKYEYYWQDNQAFKRPTKLPAPEYIKHLMNWIQNFLDDEKQFPTKIGVPFPHEFETEIKNIFRRLFRVYGHIYHSHFDHILLLEEEAHLNTSFKHFVYFILEFNLIDRKELAPLAGLIETLTGSPLNP